MANDLITFYADPQGNFTYNQRTSGLISFSADRYPYGGTGYIAGILPGVVTVDGEPAQRPVELRLRETHRNLIARTYSNPVNGTYRFDDLDPYLKYDIIARDEPNYVYKDVLVPGIWPWTDYEIILHGPPAPTSFDNSFTRTYELTGGVLPYSISGSSVIPTGVTVNLTDRTLTITSNSDPGENLVLIITDSDTLTETVTIVTNSMGGTPHAAYRVYVSSNNGASYVSLTELEMINTVGIGLTTGGTPSASSTFSAGWEADKAFDGNRNTATAWASASGGPPQWLAYQFSTPRYPEEYRMTFSRESAAEAPKSFTIQYSDDGSNWTDVWTMHNQTSWNSNQTRFFRHVDPAFSQVAAVMDPDATNGATTMTDAKGIIYTFSSSATVARANGSGFGRSYIDLPNTSSAVVTNNTSAVNILASGDFTLEAWVYFGTNPSGTYGYGLIGSENNSTNGYQLRLSSTGVEVVFPGLAGTTYNFTWAPNTMYHIYWSRAGTQHYVGVNGTGSAVSLSNRTSDGTSVVRLGAQSYGGGWVGKMAHRITKGYARYTTGNYKMPFAPFAVTAETSFSSTPVGATCHSLIHFNGTNAGTAITDEISRTWTRVGTATLSNEQSRFGSTALKIPDADSNFNAAAGILTAGQQFCLEGWIWCDPSGGAGGSSMGPSYTLCGQGGSGGSQDQYIRIRPDGAIEFNRASGLGGEGAKVIASSTGLARLGTWHHLMLTFDGTTIRLYFDGSNVGSVASTQGWINTGQVFTLGYQLVQGYPEYRTGHKGYIDEFRIITGAPVVTGSSYTVPIGPYAV